MYNVTLIITDYNDCTSNTAEVQVIAGATTPGNPYVSAGDDFTLECPELVQLSADFLEIGETDLYEVNEIAFVPPFPAYIPLRLYVHRQHYHYKMLVGFEENLKIVLLYVKYSSPD